MIGKMSKAKAKELVIKREDGMVHTFYNPSGILIGGDHSYESVLKDIDKSYACALAGKQAIALGHGLAIVPSKDCFTKDILFVETEKKTRVGVVKK